MEDGVRVEGELGGRSGVVALGQRRVAETWQTANLLMVRRRADEDKIAAARERAKQQKLMRL
jgi:hypothetical protein